MSNRDNFSEGEAYVLASTDNDIVSATKQLLWKTARSENVTPRKLEVVARILQVFEALPSVVNSRNLQIEVTGPRRTFGNHEIYHWWNIEVDNGSLCVKSQGHFYRPETGGDTFTSMIWRAFPGIATEHDDYRDNLSIVDDAQPFELEVKDIDFAKGGYSLTVFINGEELEDDSNHYEQVDDEDEGDDGITETTTGEHADQMTLTDAVRLLESAGVECAWADGEFTALSSVDLNGLALTDSVYKLFKHITILNSLEARNSDVSDSSLAFISHIGSLEWLCLRRTAVTDEGLHYLKGLSSLQHLDLSGNAIAGPGLMHLRGLKSLEMIAVSGFQHHDRWIDMLRREMPQCHVRLT